jgi:hypothetical protein
MAFAGIFQPFARLRWIRFGLLIRDRKFSRRLSVPQTTALAPVPFAPDDYFGRVFGLSGDNCARRGQQHRHEALATTAGFSPSCGSSQILAREHQI